MERLSNLLIEDAISRWKLEDYDYIMKNYQKIDVSGGSTDEDFQKTYSSFYVMNRVSKEFREFYFRIFQNIKRNENITLSEILDLLNGYKGSDKKFQFSFATKMLATIKPEKPIFDSMVKYALKDFLKIGDVSYSKLFEKKKEIALIIYNDLENWYDKNMTNSYILDWIEYFDKRLPKYRHISDVKKVDYFLWTVGRNNHKVSEFM